MTNPNSFNHFALLDTKTILGLSKYLNNKFIVYSISFPNGKEYIGYTSNFKKRIREHTLKYKNPRTVVKRAIKKYNYNIKWFICGIFNNKQDALNLEIHLIKRNQTNVKLKKGYNVTAGGEGVNGIKSWNAGKKVGSFYKSDSGTKCRETAKNNGNFIGKPPVKIKVIDKFSDVEMTYDSMGEASKATGIPHSTIRSYSSRNKDWKQYTFQRLS